MTDQLTFLATIALVFIIAVFAIANRPQYSDESPTPNVPPPKTQTKQRTKTHHEEVIDTLDWMLSNHIITPQEYTKLMGKCLQYL